MPNKWFYSDGVQTVGPLTTEQLRQGIDRALIKPDTPIWHEESKSWIAAARINGLWPNPPSRGTPQKVLQAPMQRAHKLQGDVSRNPKRQRLYLFSVAGITAAAIITLLGISVVKRDSRSTSLDDSRAAEGNNDERAAKHSKVSFADDTAAIKNAESVLQLPSDNAPQESVYRNDPTPEDLVRAYLNVETWEKKLAFVLEPEIVRPKMAAHYKEANFDAMRQLMQTAVLEPVNGTAWEFDRQVFINGHIGDQDDPDGVLRYLVVAAPEGPKIDWLRSQEAMNKARELARKALARLEFEVLAIRAMDGDQIIIDLKITNQSSALISYYALDFDLYNSTAKYLGSGFTNGNKLRAGKSHNKSIYFEHVKVAEINSWQSSAQELRVEILSGKKIELAQYCTISDATNLNNFRVASAVAVPAVGTGTELEQRPELDPDAATDAELDQEVGRLHHKLTLDEVRGVAGVAVLENSVSKDHRKFTVNLVKGLRAVEKLNQELGRSLSEKEAEEAAHPLIITDQASRESFRIKQERIAERGGKGLESLSDYEISQLLQKLMDSFTPLERQYVAATAKKYNRALAAKWSGENYPKKLEVRVIASAVPF